MADDTPKPNFREGLGRNIGLGVILTFIAGLLVYYHQATISEAARVAVKEHTSSVDRQIEAAALSIRLTEIANQLHDQDEYTKEQKDRALDLILNEVPKYAEFMNSSIFVVALERTVVSLAQANLADDIAQIDKEHRSTMIVSESLIVVLTKIFGRKLLSSPDAPNDWNTHNKLRDYLEIYDAYSIRSKEAGFPEEYLLHQMLMEDLRGRSDLVGVLTQDLTYLNETDIRAFAVEFRRYITGEFTNRLSGDDTRLICRTRDFYTQHNESLKEAVPTVADILAEELDPLTSVLCTP